MSEVEIALEPDAFEAVRTTGCLAEEIRIKMTSGGTLTSIRFVEVDGEIRTGRWTACEIGERAWPPMAACYSRNDAAARIKLEQAS